VKAADRAMTIGDIRLVRKTGGTSGTGEQANPKRKAARRRK